MRQGGQGAERYEEQAYLDQKGGGGSSEVNHGAMIEPEGLTPGYEGHSPLGDKVVAAAEQADPLYVATEVAPDEKAIEQMNELLTKKIEATLAGDTEGAAKLEQMIAMHAQRNGIAYEG